MPQNNPYELLSKLLLRVWASEGANVI
uniref:Uncharacterized protein n=1 Tax=Anguilla anguilla TaxID=7936 RepID=A0A0E9TK57_ANGAN